MVATGDGCPDCCEYLAPTIGHLRVAEAQNAVAQGAEHGISASVFLELFALGVEPGAIDLNHKAPAHHDVNPTDLWNLHLLFKLDSLLPQAKARE